MTHRTLTLNLVLVALASAVPAAQIPVTVSPGDPSRLALVESRCPTFSWGAVEGASSYELVVYRLGSPGEEGGEALRQRFQGAITSWTPSLGQCLLRGGRYGWSVRAEGDEEKTEWSAPRLFEVTVSPSMAELEGGLAAVREALGKAAEVVVKDTVDKTPTPPQPVPVPPSPPPLLTVDGKVSATSYQGDGSALAGLTTDSELSAHAADPNAHHAAFTRSGATVAAGQDTSTRPTISDLSCTEGEVPTFSSGSWACSVPYTLVRTPIVPDTLVVARCPAGTELVSGGIGGSSCVLDQKSICQSSSSQEQDCFLVSQVATSAPPDRLTGEAACEVSTVGTPPEPWNLPCDCFVICR